MDRQLFTRACRLHTFITGRKNFSGSLGAPFHKTEVLYSYEVGGATYTGETVSFGYLATGGKRAHEQIFDS